MNTRNAYRGNRVEEGPLATDGKILVVIEHLKTKAARVRLTATAKPFPNIPHWTLRPLTKAEHNW